MMLSRVGLAAVCAVAGVMSVAGLMSVAGCKSKKYEPVDFMGDTYSHVQVIRPNKYVASHFYTVGGGPVLKSDKWLQITTLSSKVTKAQRSQVDRQIRTSMRVKPFGGTTDRLFGLLGTEAIYVMMYDSSYVLHVHEQEGKDAAELKSGATEILDALSEIEYAL